MFLIRSGALRLDLDTGGLELRADEESWGWLGHIEDPEACPPEFDEDRDNLLDRWRDALGGGHRREAEWSYYERLSVARMG